MADVFVTKKKIIGTETMVYVDQYGMFHIYGVTDNQVDRQRKLGEGFTLDKAVAAARVELNKLRTEVEVPFITKSGAEGVALKRHGKNNTIMARVDGRSEQIDTHAQVFKPETPQEVITEYLEAHFLQRKRYQRLRQIEDQYTVRLDRLLDAAVAAKLAGQTEGTRS